MSTRSVIIGTHISVGYLSYLLLWRQRIGLGAAFLIQFLPAMLVSGALIRWADLEPQRQSALGHYVAHSLPPSMQAVRMPGNLVITIGAWRQRPDLLILGHLWADGGYSRELIEWWRDKQGLTIEIVGKQPGQRSFVLAPRRWVVERMFATLGRARRLSKDYEFPGLCSESTVYLASIESLLRRLAPDAMTTTRYHATSPAA